MGSQSSSDVPPADAQEFGKEICRQGRPEFRAKNAEAFLIESKEVMELMSALTEDHTFEKAYNDVLEGGEISMKTLINFIQEEADRDKERASDGEVISRERARSLIMEGLM